ncbi:MAG: hypothetical protein IKE55_12775 [Kiritimatiellae bacterium]|nr:hypothetical protein [Kiritimatiellia bacterium]
MNELRMEPNAFWKALGALYMCAVGICSAALGKDILYIADDWRGNLQDKRLCEPVFGRLLEREGWDRFRWVAGPDYVSREDILNAKLVVVNEGRFYSLDRHDLEFMDAIVGYVRAGGGLVIVNNFSQMFSRMELPLRLMMRFGGRILLETVPFPSGRIRQVGEFSQDQWCYTDRVFPPFNKGVARVMVRATCSYGAEHGCTPFLPDANWKTALSAGRDVGSVPFPATGLGLLDERIRKKGFDGDAPIVGYREFGRGRVVYFGVSEYLGRFSQGPDDPVAKTLEVVSEKGLPGEGPSGLARFCRNLFAWAAENSDSVAASAVPELLTRKDAESRLPRGFRVYRGVVGPRTVYSGGKSTAAEYVAKAKSLGLDYIVFLEDLNRLSAADFEKLRDFCREASDDSFSAWAGYTYEKDNGNHQYAFSNEPIYPGKKILTQGRKFRSLWFDAPERGFRPGYDANFSGGHADLDFFYGMLGFKNNLGWYRFRDSPYRPTDNRCVNSMGVITRVNGKTVADDLDVYALNNRADQSLIPIALELVDSADLLTTDSYTMSMGIEGGINAFRGYMISHVAHSGYPGVGLFGRNVVSNGPEIDFAPVRGDIGPDADLLYSAKLPNWPYTLRVTSDHGLVRIDLYDGDRSVRTWRPNGAKEFSRRGAFPIERQRYLWVKAVDAKGRIAFTRASNCESHLLRETTCNDRENRLFYSCQPRPDKSAPPFLSSYSADTCTPDKGPWVGRVRPVGFFVFDKKYGVGGQGGFDGSPENHPKMNLVPSIEYGGAPSERHGWSKDFVAGREGAAHNFANRIVASADALVGERVLDGVFEYGRRPVVHVWHSLFPVFDTAYADTKARCSLFLPKLDGVVPYQWEQRLVLKSPVPSAKDRPIVDFGTLVLSSGNGGVEALAAGMRIKNAMKGRLRLQTGDFVVERDSKYGSLAVIALAPVFFENGRFFQVGDGSECPVGSAFDCNLVLMGMNKFTEDPFASAVAAVKAYGIGTDKPEYRAMFASGSGKANGVMFDASAANDALVGRFEGVAALPGTLGLRLSGLDDRRTALLAGRRGIRIIPVEDGIGYAALRAEESDADLFVGHPLRSSSAALSLTLTRPVGGAWHLEVHNPTASPVRAKISTHPAFKGFAFARGIEVAAGSSLDFEIE